MDFNMKKLASDAGVFFTRAVQFTEEKFGQAEKTELDAHFENLLARADSTKNWTEKILRQTEVLLQPNPSARVEEFLYEKLDRKVPSRVTNGELLAQYMIEAANDFGPGTPYGKTLIKVGETERRLGGAERDFIHSSSINFLSPLRNFLEGDWRTISKERRILQNRRLDLDACKARLKKAKAAEAKAACEGEVSSFACKPPGQPSRVVFSHTDQETSNWVWILLIRAVPTMSGQDQSVCSARMRSFPFSPQPVDGRSPSAGTSGKGLLCLCSCLSTVSFVSCCSRAAQSREFSLRRIPGAGIVGKQVPVHLALLLVEISTRGLPQQLEIGSSSHRVSLSVCMSPVAPMQTGRGQSTFQGPRKGKGGGGEIWVGNLGVGRRRDGISVGLAGDVCRLFWMAVLVIASKTEPQLAERLLCNSSPERHFHNGPPCVRGQRQDLLWGSGSGTALLPWSLVPQIVHPNKFVAPEHSSGPPNDPKHQSPGNEAEGSGRDRDPHITPRYHAGGRSNSPWKGSAVGHVNHLRCLHEFAEAQATYYAQCYQYMLDLQKQLGSSRGEMLPGTFVGNAESTSPPPATASPTALAAAPGPAVPTIPVVPTVVGVPNSAPAVEGLSPSDVKPPASGTRKARVLYDYQAADSSELSLLADEMITVYSLPGMDPDWLVGERGNQKGKVPVTYLELLS
ncbi:endophilin-B2 [Sphaerodactylus townsendi]|uniref:endophilin-B2 n=1 Tax=Sphaerodactylus townsendi TaxID=933632 RepID=UPI0020264A39|nr:endophilin-B2 [Sphaerodactylus townsendi]